MMEQDIIVVNNFYKDPYKIREYALTLHYPIVSEIPGQRSIGVIDNLNLELKTKFENILGKNLPKWQPFRKRGQLENTCFQSINEGETNWVHHDNTDWAAVLYLNPDANPNSGTGLFTHIETGISQYDANDPNSDLNNNADRFDLSKWRCNIEVKNQFNRLIIYRGTYYHSSMIAGFGNNYINGRLTQVFFFNE
jgi:hypothetical protein